MNIKHKISDIKIKCLHALRTYTKSGGEMCCGFAIIEAALHIDRTFIRRAIRALAREGFAEYHKGLIGESGEFAGSGYCISQQGIKELERLDSTTRAQEDNDAVDQFAIILKDKLSIQRAKGYQGWQHTHSAFLMESLRAHVEKGDMRDVALYAMFLHMNAQSLLDETTFQ